MQKPKVTIGVAPTRRELFVTSEAIRYKDIVLQKLAGMDVDFVDLNDIHEEGLLVREEDLPKVIDKFTKADVDGLFFPHCNFGSEFLVAQLAKALGKPVLLWGPRDDVPPAEGTRTRDSQCGLFATGKVLRRFQVPFTYLINSSPDAPSFVNGLSMFLAVCAAVRGFRSLRILQISTRPSSFWSMMVNEGELLERFGIQIHPVALPDLLGMVKLVKEENGAEYRETMEYIKRVNSAGLGNEEHMSAVAALKTAIRRCCADNACTAVAIQCWYALNDALGIMPCISNGLLAEEGLPVVCETDIHGAVSAILLQEAARRVSPVFFADFTIRHPYNDNAELLWHCGNFPPQLANGDVVLGSHSMPPYCPGTGHFELKRGDITVCRFDGDNGAYKLFFGEGQAVDGPKTKGTYLWMEVSDWEQWEYKLVNGPYVHHCAGIHAKVAPVLFEACKYIPGLEADPVEPDEKQILRAWMKGI